MTETRSYCISVSRKGSAARRRLGSRLAARPIYRFRYTL